MHVAATGYCYYYHEKHLSSFALMDYMGINDYTLF